jgi:copper transporter 1
MLWNWNVVGSCFISSSWHIDNNAMFAASCIGTAFLVMCLEFLRRASHEYDAYLLRQFQRRLQHQQAALALSTPASCCDGPIAVISLQYATFRVTALQQLLRAILHGATLGVAYLVMLLVMYYNGFIFISVILGAVLGKFMCDWMVVRMPYGGPGEKEVLRSGTGAGPTGCCA